MYPKTSIDHEIINYYYNGCPICCKAVCICQPYLSRATNLFDPDAVRELARTLEKVSKNAPEHQGELADLYRSVSAVLETQDDPLARLTLFQAKSVIQNLIEKMRGTRGVENTLLSCMRHSILPTGRRGSRPPFTTGTCTCPHPGFEISPRNWQCQPCRCIKLM